MLKIDAYLCSHCAVSKKNKGRTFRSFAGVKKHEDTCFFNPSMKACVTCCNFLPMELPLTPDECGEPRACFKGHELEMRYISPEGNAEGGLRNRCRDWEPLAAPSAVITPADKD